MLRPHHLLSQIPLRVDTAVRRLQGAIWKDVQPLEIMATDASPDLRPLNEARKLPRKKVQAPSAWGQLFDQRWCQIVLPKKLRPELWLHWKEQGEATLHVDGTPSFGFDVAHRYCRLPTKAKELWVEALCVQSAIWHPDFHGLSPQGSLFEGAWLVSRDDLAWHVYHDLKCLLDTALCLRQQENPSLLPQVAPGGVQPPVEKHSPAYRRLLRLMDDAVDALDRDGLTGAQKVLAAAYAELRADRSVMTAALTGHAHIDLVWLWPERIGEMKAVHTFSTVDRLMDDYPEFRFAYSQPASYEAVRRRAPGLYRRVEKRIGSGIWQATGAMYVESDTLLACGEALLRSFLVGQKCFSEITGHPARLTWLPDVFGYSACLPQMMRLAGVEWFFTTKMTWNLVNRFPYSSFVWRGNDGTEVLAHVTQDCGYNASLEAGELRASSWGHQQGDIHQEYLLPVGYGDGGGGPTAEMCERARRLSALPAMPATRWEQPEEFFARLAPLKPELPVLSGECYLEAHRGTYTTHGAVKAAFRQLERALQMSEAVSSVTGIQWDRLPIWKRLIFCQFHDFIPGSAVWDVYEEGVPELQRLAGGQLEEAGKALHRKNGKPCFFNPHAVPVSKWISHQGEMRHLHLPPLGSIGMDSTLAESPASVRVVRGHVTNGLSDFEIDANGWIRRASLAGREVLLAGPAAQLLFFHDKPARFEAWDIDRQTLTDGQVCDSHAKVTSFSESHRGGVIVRRRVGEKSLAEVRLFLVAGDPLLHVEVTVEWQDEYGLLKLLLPTGYAAVNARFGIPYGSVLRAQVTSSPASEAQWEVPFSRWLAVFDEGESEGVFMVTEAKYGATVRDGVIGLSLVRSPKAVGYDGMRVAWPPHLSRVKGPAQHTDLGTHRIKLALGAYHSGLARREHPASLADTLFTEPLPYVGSLISSPIREMSGGETLVPAWAQPLSAKEWILRLHEVNGRRGSLRIQSAGSWQVAGCSALGEPDGEAAEDLSVTFTPYQIVSVLFRRP